MGSPIRRILSWLPSKEQELLRSARWELARLRAEDWYLDRGGQQSFLRRAFAFIQRNGIGGDYVEFGCWTGMTFVMAYRESRRAGLGCKLWAFDSFLGLPEPKGPEEDYPTWVKGAMRTTLDEFHSIMKRKGVPASAYTVVPGYYEETLSSPGSVQEFPADICFAYIDCDLYQSAKAILKFLIPWLKPAMLIAFDDYYCYTRSGISGERRACAEAFGANSDWRMVPYIQYGWSGMSFVIERRENPPTG
jgi:O-methyltransferase